MKKNILDMLVFILISLPVGLVFLYYVMSYSGSFSLSDFSEITKHRANIESISVEKSGKTEFMKRTGYFIKARYTYEVDSRLYSSDTVSLGYAQWKSKDEALLVLDKIKAQSVAYVSTDNPEKALLIAPDETVNLTTISLFLQFGVLFGIFGLLNICDVRIRKV